MGGRTARRRDGARTARAAAVAAGRARRASSARLRGLGVTVVDAPPGSSPRAGRRLPQDESNGAGSESNGGGGPRRTPPVTSPRPRRPRPGRSHDPGHERELHRRADADARPRRQAARRDESLDDPGDDEAQHQAEHDARPPAGPPRPARRPRVRSPGRDDRPTEPQAGAAGDRDRRQLEQAVREDEPEELPGLPGRRRTGPPATPMFRPFWTRMYAVPTQNSTPSANARNDTWMLLTSTLVENSAAGRRTSSSPRSRSRAAPPARSFGTATSRARSELASHAPSSERGHEHQHAADARWPGGTPRPRPGTSR